MELRQSLGTLAIAALVVLAGCAGSAADAPTTTEPEPEPDVTSEGTTVKLVEEADEGARIVVKGDYSIDAEPDRARISLNVIATGESSAAVRNGLAENASALREALVEDGPLGEDQLRSERFRIRENRRARHESDVPPYRGYHRFVIDLGDVDAVEDVIDTAVEAADVEVDHVEFGLSDERRAELRKEALREAMTNARGEAELLASTEGLELDGVDSMVTDRVHVEPSRAAVVMESAAAPAATPAPRTRIDADDVTVSVSVRVAYTAADDGA